MTIKRTYWIIGFITLVVIAAVIIIVAMFGRNKSSGVNYFDALIESKDALIREKDAHQATIKSFLDYKDIVIADLRKEDSALAYKSQQTRIVYEKIPGTVRNYSHEELRSAVWDY